MVYGLIVLESGLPLADTVYHLTALVIVVSILAHSSTDVLIARHLARQAPGQGGITADPRRGA